MHAILSEDSKEQARAIPLEDSMERGLAIPLIRTIPLEYSKGRGLAVLSEDSKDMPVQSCWRIAGSVGRAILSDNRA